MKSVLSDKDKELIRDYLQCTKKDVHDFSQFYNEEYLARAKKFFKTMGRIKSGLKIAAFGGMFTLVLLFYIQRERDIESDAVYSAKKREVEQIEQNLDEKRAQLQHIRDSLLTVYRNEMSKTR